MDEPIGRCNNLKSAGDNLVGTFQFAPVGISDAADRACGLLKNGALNATSIGFSILDIAPKAKDGTRLVTSAVLNEISLVAVPALNSALVISRAAGDRASTLLRSAREHTSATLSHRRSIESVLNFDDLAAAALPHQQMRDNLRACAGALDEAATLNLPTPGAKADALLSEARTNAHGAAAAHQRLGAALASGRSTACETPYSSMARCVRGCIRALRSLDDLDRTPTAASGALGVLADPANQGTSKTIAEQNDPNTKIFGYRPTNC
jgi:Caudovirus prohead serine protease